MNKIDQEILELARTVQAAVLTARAGLSEEEFVNSGFDQMGIANGLATVREYFEHNERGLALEHVVYMLDETEVAVPQAVSEATRLCLLLGLKSPRTP